ncbi:hypothetical protein ACHAWF_015719, partial [Thalassiosira exigua]
GSIHSVDLKPNGSTFFRSDGVSSSPALKFSNRDDDKEVDVNLMEVDAFTLTAVGFGLIAFNFLVLANMGDVGLAGIVARIMNTFG